jgi:hypothetical protein
LLGLAPTELGLTGVGFDGGGSYPCLLNFVFQGHVLCLSNRKKKVLCLSVAVVMGMAKWALKYLGLSNGIHLAFPDTCIIGILCCCEI